MINNILKFHLTTSFVYDNKFHIKLIDRFHKIDFIKLDESMIYLFFYFLLPIVQTGIKYFFFFHNSTTNIYIHTHDKIQIYNPNINSTELNRLKKKINK